MGNKTVNIELQYRLEALEKSFSKVEGKLRNQNKRLENFGKRATLMITAPIVAGIGAAVKEFAEFEESMAKINAVTGASAQEFEQLTSLAAELGRTTRFTAKEVAGLELNYAKLGFSTTEINKITEATLDLALATSEDLGRSAEVAGSTLRGFNLEGSEMQRVVDVMAKSFSSSALDLEKFYVSISKVAPIAAVTGRSLEEVAAQQSVLADTGVEASIIGTSLRKIYGDLAKSGMSYADAMATIRASTNKVATATELFDIRAAAAAVTLAQQQDKVDRLKATYDKASGSAKEMGDIMNNTLQMSFIRLKSAVEGLAIEMGKQLAPMLRAVAERVANLARYFAELSEPSKKMILVFLGLAAVLPPLIMMVGQLAIAMRALGVSYSSVMTTGSAVLGIFTATVLIVEGFNKLIEKHSGYYNRSKTYLDKLNGSMEDYKRLIQDVNKVKLQGVNASKEEVKQLKKETVERYDAIQALIAETIQRKKRLQESIQSNMEALGRQGGGMRGEAMDAASLAAMAGMRKKVEILSKDINDLGEAGQDLLDKLKELQKVGKEVKEEKGSVIDLGIGGADPKDLRSKYTLMPDIEIEPKNLNIDKWNTMVKKAMDELSETTAKAGKEVFEKTDKLVLDVVTSFGKRQIQYIEETTRMVESMTEDAIFNMADMFGTMLTDENFTGKDFGRGMLEMIAGFMQELGALMIAFGIQYSLFEKAIFTGNPVLAIVAGAAMVAAGAAIKGAMADGVDGKGGGSSYNSPSVGNRGVSNNNTDFSSEVRIQGRQMIIVQKRESSFRR